MSKAILETAKSVRRMIIHQIGAIPESSFDVQPAPFNNTIRWNTGHIAACFDFFFSLALPGRTFVPESYGALFGTGKKPSDWEVAPPSKEELLSILTKQLEALSDIDPAVLEQSLQTPIVMGPMRFETVGETLNFGVVHETMHSSTISCLARIVAHQQ